MKNLGEALPIDVCVLSGAYVAFEDRSTAVVLVWRQRVRLRNRIQTAFLGEVGELGLSKDTHSLSSSMSS